MSSHGDSVQNGQGQSRFQALFSEGQRLIGKLGPFGKLRLLLDVSWEKFRYGTAREDYFQYEFYKKNQRGRREFINYKRREEIISVCNDPS